MSEELKKNNDRKDREGLVQNYCNFLILYNNKELRYSCISLWTIG